MDGEGAPPQLDTSEAHSARVWNYLLGGKDNISQVVPAIPYSDPTVVADPLPIL
jgi:S-adenosyl methyltransferase